MLQSMTGYGKSICELDTKKITVEIKSLNSKQLDLNIRLPNIYKEKELEIRNEVAKDLKRGKIEVYINYETGDSGNNAEVNKKVVQEYYTQLNDLAKELKVDFSSEVIPALMRLPDSLIIKNQELDDKEWMQIIKTIRKALKELIEYRRQEGKVLQKDIIKRIGNIETFLKQVSKYEPQRIENIKNKMLNNLNEHFKNNTYDKNRFEQELIYYLEKIDVTEEKVRLKNHCNYFTTTVNKDENPGKKLGFISQEIGREINTIGSKANDSDIQKIIVQMKDELEKIKEQLLNIL